MATAMETDEPLDTVENQDEKLFTFQEIAGLETLEECRNYLESTDWDLQKALNLVFAAPPNPTSNFSIYAHPVSASSSGAAATASSSEYNFTENDKFPPANHVVKFEKEDILDDNPFAALVTDPQLKKRVLPRRKIRPRAGNSSSANEEEKEDEEIRVEEMVVNEEGKIIEFNIDYMGRMAEVSMNENETFGTLKGTVSKILFGACGKEKKFMIFTGWPKGCVSVTDNTILKKLALPRKVTLQLHCDNDDQSGELLAKKYKLAIEDITNDQIHHIYGDGTKTVADIKKDVYSLTDILPSRQLWGGWPPAASHDEVRLAYCCLDEPVHNLTVEELHASPQPVTFTSCHEQTRDGAEYDSDGRSSSPEYADAADHGDTSLNNSLLDQSPLVESPESFLDGAEASTKQLTVPLIPGDVTSPHEALDNFVRVFESRNGPIHPQFFVGSLQEALLECFAKPLSERRPLAVYLHHDDSVASNIFCSQILCSEEVCNMLSANFVTWPWDLTLDENAQKLLEWVNEFLGEGQGDFIRALRPNSFPIICLVGKQRGTYELIGAGLPITGVMSVEEVMLNLIQGMETFSQMVAVEMEEERERGEREVFRQEQMFAYNEALEMDKQKELEKRKQEEEKRLEELKQKKIEAEKTKRRNMLAAKLPEEPEENCGRPLVSLRLRLPNGQSLARRFLAEEKLKTLLMFAASEGYPPEEFRMLTSFPKRDLSAEDGMKTLKELNLCAREQVTLEQV